MLKWTCRRLNMWLSVPESEREVGWVSTLHKRQIRVSNFSLQCPALYPFGMSIRRLVLCKKKKKKKVTVFLVRKKPLTANSRKHQRGCTLNNTPVVLWKRKLGFFWAAGEQGRHENQNKHVCPNVSCLSTTERARLICVSLVFDSNWSQILLIALLG